MDVEQFRATLRSQEPPAGLSLALAGLWWDGKGEWEKAHDSAQRDQGPDGSWVHAYLHRKEGDESNAAYWYRRAGKSFCRTSLAEEWTAIARSLLSQL